MLFIDCPVRVAKNTALWNLPAVVRMVAPLMCTSLAGVLIAAM